MKVGHNENVIQNADHIRKRTLDKLTDNEPVVEFRSMKRIHNDVKDDSYVSSDIVSVRKSNNGNNTIDNNNQTLPDANDTLCNANTNSTDANEISGLCRSTRRRNSPPKLNYV